MPTIGVFEPAISRATRNIVPSPPNTISKSVDAASFARSFSRTAVRPDFSISPMASRTNSCDVSFSGFATSPTRAIVSANFFKQHQKFFVPGRPEQRRFGDGHPAQRQLCGDKLLQLSQYSFVHRRIGDHTRALVRLGFAGFELRLDQRDD